GCRDGRSPSRTPGRASSRGACVGGQGREQHLLRHEFRSQQQQQKPQQQEQPQEQPQEQQRDLGPSAGTGSCSQLLQTVQPIKQALTTTSDFYFLHLDLVAFYFPGASAPCDEKCRADFLGNFWDLGPDRLKLAPPGSQEPRNFRTAEGAYQALKFWNSDDARAFEAASGDQALKLSRVLSNKGIEIDTDFAGYGNPWQAMRAVLAAKFIRGGAMANALKKTENAFLLEHNSFTGRDNIWSDNCDGSGKNWLGLLLMLRRTELFYYSFWLRACVDDQTGSFHNREWADKVQEAARRINLELGQVHSDSSSLLGAFQRVHSRSRVRVASPRAAGMPSDRLKHHAHSITSQPCWTPQSSCLAPCPVSSFEDRNLPTVLGTTNITRT
ncbi:unnamed protein product, partial [Polarella glacialis]